MCIINKYYNSPKVTKISSSTFSNCKNLENVIITGNLTSIGYNAFSGCISLTNIILPESIESIESIAFYDCISLTNITIPSKIKHIGSYAFQNCINLKNITFLNNTNSIRFGQNIFYGIENQMNIFITGNFNISSDSDEIIPKRSHLFITNGTTLSESCKSVFGKKSVYVHYDNAFDISDQMTKDVIKYISIPLEIQRSKDDLVYFQTKCIHLVSLIHSIKS